MLFNNKKIISPNLFVVVGAIIISINIGVIISGKNIIIKNVKANEEVKRPANISLIIIKDSSCTDCADISPVIATIKRANIKVEKEETFEAATPEGEKQIREFGIKKIPSFVIKGEISKNNDVKNLLSKIGEINGDTFKFNYAFAPYFDIDSSSIKGKVSLVLFTDKSCTECYDYNIHKSILARFGITKFFSEKTLDRFSAEGRVLIAKYNIKAVPTFVLTGEVGEYGNLVQIWPKVGTIERDGAYVFREIAQLGPVVYRDLMTGKVVKPATTSTTPSSSPASVSK